MTPTNIATVLDRNPKGGTFVVHCETTDNVRKLS